MKRLLLLGCALGLAGCQTLTPAQQAALFCVVSADGVVIAQNTTKGGAQATANTVAGATPVLCDAATKVGAALTKQ